MLQLSVYQTNHVVRLPRPALIAQSLLPRKRAAAPREYEDFDHLLSEYALKPAGEVQQLPGSFRNETWLVPTTAGRKVIKRYKTSLPYDQVLHEHSILTRLKELDFPAPCLAETGTGQTILEHNNRFYGLFDYLEGYYKFHSFVTFPSQEDWFLSSCGQVLAALHKSLDGFTPSGKNVNGFSGYDGERERDIAWYLNILSTCRQSAPGTAVHPQLGRLDKMAGWIHDQLLALEERLTQAGLKRSVVHGDFGPYNLMVKPGQRLMVLDFELARIDWCMVDLIALISTTTSSHTSPDQRRIGRVFRAYRDSCDLPEEELRHFAALWEYLLLRRMIPLWDEYQRLGRRQSLVELQRRFDRLDWLCSHRAHFETLSFLRS